MKSILKRQAKTLGHEIHKNIFVSLVAPLEARLLKEASRSFPSPILKRALIMPKMWSLRVGFAEIANYLDIWNARIMVHVDFIAVKYRSQFLASRNKLYLELIIFGKKHDFDT